MRRLRIPAWVWAAAFFAVMVPVFLSHAVVPWALHLQPASVDAVLSPTIAEHTSRALFGHSPFWDLNIFYPLRDTVCLSDPMLLQALFFAPAYKLLGPAITRSLFYYACWFAVAMATYLYLRSRGYHFAACLWGGCVAAFTPARAWHAAGHDHLIFTAGFPLILLLVEKAATSKRQVLWASMAGLCIGVQCMGGFYLTFLFGVWLLMMAPYLLHRLLLARKTSSVAWKPLLVLAVWLAVLAVGALPIVQKYKEFGAAFPSGDFRLPNREAATVAGYLSPPFHEDMFATVLGRLLHYVGVPAAELAEENCNYLGVVPLILACVALWQGCVGLWRRTTTPLQIAYACCLLAAAAVGFVLSLGPYLWHRAGAGFLPFAYMYAYVPPLRFFRVPARFGIIVQWSITLGAAAGLSGIVQHLMARNKRGWRLLSAVVHLPC